MQNQRSGAQYDAERTSPEQNQLSDAQYDAEHTSPEQDQQNGAQHDTLCGAQYDANA